MNMGNNDMNMSNTGMGMGNNNTNRNSFGQFQSNTRQEGGRRRSRRYRRR